MANSTLTPKEIALSQLNMAIALYMRGEDLISVITLAGAAEEILGKLARLGGKTPSLDRRIEFQIEMFTAIFPNSQTPAKKEFVNICNKFRNAFKHLTTTESFQVDLEEQSSRLLARAIENYVLLFGSQPPLMLKFHRKRLQNIRALSC